MIKLIKDLFRLLEVSIEAAIMRQRETIANVKSRNRDF